jgi:hypothetical protein
MNQQVIADICIAVFAISLLIAGFVWDGYLFKLSLVWGGLGIGYVMTTYLNIKEEYDDEI